MKHNLCVQLFLQFRLFKTPFPSCHINGKGKTMFVDNNFKIILMCWTRFACVFKLIFSVLTF